MEFALRRLFPSGEIEAITQSLLVDDSPNIQLPLLDAHTGFAAEDASLGDPLNLDDLIRQSQTSSDRAGTGFQTTLELFDQFQINGPHLPFTPGEQVEFLDNYFLHYHKIYPLLHEDYFRHRLENRSTTSA